MTHWKTQARVSRKSGKLALESVSDRCTWVSTNPGQTPRSEPSTISSAGIGEGGGGGGWRGPPPPAPAPPGAGAEPSIYGRTYDRARESPPDVEIAVSESDGATGSIDLAGAEPAQAILAVAKLAGIEHR